MPTPMPEPPVALLPEFSEEQVTALLDYMESAGRVRAQAQGADFDETNYLAGCMATLFALGKQSRIPAGWIFMTFAGKSPLGLPMLDREVHVVHDPKNRRQPITLYENHGEADEHVSYLSDHDNYDVLTYRLPVRHALRPDIAEAIEKESEATEQ